MNKNELYEKLLNAFKDHSNKNTLQTTYVNSVLRIVKDYLQYDSLKQAIEVLKDKMQLNIYINGFNEKTLSSVVDTPKQTSTDWFITLNEEEYDLLKEVLDNDK